MKLSDTSIKRYQEIISLNNEWEVETPFGWSPLSHVMKTIPYKVWKLTLFNGLFIEGADTHILINSEGEEVFLKDLKKWDLITTQEGDVSVLSVEEQEREEEMFDLDINDSSHVFWTNDILSHNCVLSDTFVTVLEDEKGSPKDITIKELYELLCNQRQEEE
jgi:hypothetical protein